MVPSPDTAAWSVSSNELYAHGVERVFNETADKHTPGQDYSYLQTYYPPQWKSPDLKGQIDQFLAMPKPRHASRETLWVFSFGTWDVWSLSALPNSVGHELAAGMTKDIFKQIDRLYEASTNPMSIAWSDSNSVPPPAVPDAASEETTEETAAESQPERRDEEAEENQAEAEKESEKEAEKEPEVPVESFRILIPRIVDPSLLPGWRDLRPVLPKVHSKAEQMRNSAELTISWNDGIVSSLSNWVKKADKKPEMDEKRDGDEKESRDVATGAEAERAEDEAKPAAVKPAPASKSSLKAVTYPVRDGFAYNLADYLLVAMVERQLRNARLKDGNGLGDGPLEDGYRDVSNACVQAVSTVAVSVSVESGITLDIPNREIGKDVQVPTTEPTPPRVSRREGAAGGDGDGDGAGAGSQAQAQAQAASTVKVCEIPSDHLFYTPFALSQRAIGEIAGQSAELVRSSDTVRAKLMAGS